MVRGMMADLLAAQDFQAWHGESHRRFVAMPDA
jgi:hypothetical protein